MAILERYRHASSRPLRVLSARQGVYPSHLAASFSTVPSSWSFLMASLIALVSSGLSLFTATAYFSHVPQFQGNAIGVGAVHEICCGRLIGYHSGNLPRLKSSKAFGGGLVGNNIFA